MKHVGKTILISQLPTYFLDINATNKTSIYLKGAYHHNREKVCSLSYNRLEDLQVFKINHTESIAKLF